MILFFSNFLEVVCARMLCCPAPVNFGSAACATNVTSIFQAVPPTIRKDFPDTWLWECMIDERSETHIKKLALYHTFNKTMPSL